MSRESVQAVNDEKLMAYVNGALTESERVEVEEALGIDHEFRAKLEEISRAVDHVDDILKTVMAEELSADSSPDEQPTRPRVVKKDESEQAPSSLSLEAEQTMSLPATDSEVDSSPIEVCPPPSSGAESILHGADEKGAGVAVSPESGVKRGSRWFRRMVMVVVTFGAGVGGYYYGHASAASVPSVVPATTGVAVVGADTPLHQALQSVPSQELFFAHDGSDEIVLPIISFQANDGRYCRQFEINSFQAISMGLACSRGAGWRIEMLMAAGERAPGSKTFQSASSVYKDAMSIVFDRLWSGSHLDEEKERSLIARGWQGR